MERASRGNFSPGYSGEEFLVLVPEQDIPTKGRPKPELIVASVQPPHGKYPELRSRLAKAFQYFSLRKNLPPKQVRGLTLQLRNEYAESFILDLEEIAVSRDEVVSGKKEGRINRYSVGTAFAVSGAAGLVVGSGLVSPEVGFGTAMLLTAMIPAVPPHHQYN